VPGAIPAAAQPQVSEWSDSMSASPDMLWRHGGSHYILRAPAKFGYVVELITLVTAPGD